MAIRPITIQKTGLDTLMLIMFSGRKAREGTYVSIKCVHTTHIQHPPRPSHTHTIHDQISCMHTSWLYISNKIK